MPQRKHITEIALGFFSTYLVVLLLAPTEN